MSENELIEYKYVVSVRFRCNSKPYSFGTNDGNIEYGDYLVIETAQGIEVVECISSLREISTYSSNMELKPILRKATLKDIENYKKNIEDAKEAKYICEERVKELNLQMQLVSADYTLDKSKILFVYIADDRVDFRELLKFLANDLKCRIELKQIGARDKAKLVGGIGVCGRECCCAKFKNDFDVIGINMAKNQMLSLNVPKLSGQCGKFMCCLKYEDEQYKEIVDGLPKMNSKVEYNSKIYIVTAINVISDDIKLQNKDEVINVTIKELKDKGIISKPITFKKSCCQSGCGGCSNRVSN